MNLSEFDYNLPKNLIAQSPVEKRDASRLLVLNSEIVHDQFKNLITYLDEGDVLVLNDSRVVHAKLVGRKKTGGKVELLLINSSGVNAACLIKGGRLRVGTEIEIGDVTCEVTEKTSNGYKVKFTEKMDNLIERFGEVPLPHYIKEPIKNPERYQTIYAENSGSIAAPTAGLHFTKELLTRAIEKGLKIAYITLHIGPSTFLPIRDVENIGPITPEYFAINKENARIINDGIKNRSLIPVGTTVVKALESSVKNDIVSAGTGWSDRFISPGYDFKVPIKGMVTNFHLPRSSLLLLVSALFGTNRVLSAYSEAVVKGYRFYSFGDAMLILR